MILLDPHQVQVPPVAPPVVFVTVDHSVPIYFSVLGSKLIYLMKVMI